MDCRGCDDVNLKQAEVLLWLYCVARIGEKIQTQAQFGEPRMALNVC
jgi:hypothetical protein